MYIRFTDVFDEMDADAKKTLAILLGTSVMTLRHYARSRYKFSATRAVQTTDALRKMGYEGAMKGWCRPDLFVAE